MVASGPDTAGWARPVQGHRRSMAQARSRLKE